MPTQPFWRIKLLLSRMAIAQLSFCTVGNSAQTCLLQMNNAVQRYQNFQSSPQGKRNRNSDKSVTLMLVTRLKTYHHSLWAVKFFYLIAKSQDT